MSPYIYLATGYFPGHLLRFIAFKWLLYSTVFSCLQPAVLAIKILKLLFLESKFLPVLFPSLFSVYQFEWPDYVARGRVPQWERKEVLTPFCAAC